MIDDLKLIQSNSLEVINASGELTMKMLKLYSVLFLNGGRPNICGACIKRYYAELKNNGLKKLADMKDTLNRTCVPDIKGLKYIPKIAKHIDNASLTDKEALYLLNNGLLKVTDFKKLPDSYQVKAPTVKQTKAKANIKKDEPTITE